MDFVEEPLSGALLPVELDASNADAHPSQSRWTLLCSGMRAKRIGFLDIKVYALGVYGDPEAIFCGKSFSGSGDEAVKTLQTSTAEKVFTLTFLRSVSASQIQDGLAEALVKGAGVPQGQMDLLSPHLPNLDKGTELRLHAQTSTGELKLRINGGDERVLQLPEVCHGLHDMYFGANPIVNGVPESLQRQQPWVHALPSLPDRERTISFDSTTPQATEESSDHVVPAAKEEAGPSLASIPSGNMLAETAATSPSRKKSWKESSGRSHGKEGYRFGDFTRSLVKRGKNRPSIDSTSSLENDDDDVSETPFSPLVVEADGENAAWVLEADVPHLTAETFASQSLENVFYKHHSAPLRGRLIPQWSERYYELKNGELQYRRQAGGKLSPAFSLDGARVIAEPVKASRMGECFVFRVVQGSEVLVRLSCTERQVAVEWVLALAASCAYLRSGSSGVRTPPVEKCTPEKEAAAKAEPPAEAVHAAAPQPETLAAVRSSTASTTRAVVPVSKSTSLPSFISYFTRMQRRDLLRLLVPLLIALFAMRRLRRRGAALG